VGRKQQRRQLGEDAQEASDELERLLGHHGDVPTYVRVDMAVWDVAEWMEGSTTDPETLLADAGLLPESDPYGEAVAEAAKGCARRRKATACTCRGASEAICAI
jgi:hypothetical protein